MLNELDELKHKFKTVTDQLKSTIEELDRCRRSLKVANVPSGNAWFWSGDRKELSHNGITLTCPVVIEAEDLSSVFEDLDFYKKSYREEKTARDSMAEELEEKRTAMIAYREELNKEYEARNAMLSKFGLPGETMQQMFERLWKNQSP